jgi:hypothetical protein
LIAINVEQTVWLFSILSRQPIVASKHCERRPWGCWLMLWLNVMQAIVVVAVVVVAVAMFFFSSAFVVVTYVLVT